MLNLDGNELFPEDYQTFKTDGIQHINFNVAFPQLIEWSENRWQNEKCKCHFCREANVVPTKKTKRALFQFTERQLQSVLLSVSNQMLQQKQRLTMAIV